MNINPHVFPLGKPISPQEHHRSLVKSTVITVLIIILGLSYWWLNVKQQTTPITPATDLSGPPPRTMQALLPSALSSSTQSVIIDQKEQDNLASQLVKPQTPSSSASKSSTTKTPTTKTAATTSPEQQSLLNAISGTSAR